MGQVSTAEVMAPKDDRPRIASLGEWYEDLLAVDAAVNGRSEAQQATSLLCAKLQEREERVKARIRYLAAKRGVTFEAMWLQIIKGEYRKLSAAELADLQTIDPFTE